MYFLGPSARIQAFCLDRENYLPVAKEGKRHKRQVSAKIHTAPICSWSATGGPFLMDDRFVESAHDGQRHLSLGNCRSMGVKNVFAED